jgi:hypothetical protein
MWAAYDARIPAAMNACWALMRKITNVFTSSAKTAGISRPIINRKSPKPIAPRILIGIIVMDKPPDTSDSETNKVSLWISAVQRTYIHGAS